VQEVFSLTGEADYLIRLIVPDLKALSRILNDAFLPRVIAASHVAMRMHHSRKSGTGVLFWALTMPPISPEQPARQTVQIMPVGQPDTSIS
jgi:DNA-binding Lrp family transcriptional regulator